MPTATKNINAEKIQGNLSVTSVTGSFTGSLTGIASTASFVNPLNQNVLITGSTQITGSLGVTGSIYSNNTIGASYAGYFKNNSYNVGGNAPLMVDDGNAGGAFSIGYGGTSAFMYFPPYFGNNSIYLHGSGYYGVYFEGLSSYDGVTSFVAPGRVKIGNNTLPSSKLHVVGAGSTSATTTFLTQNSSGTDLLKVTDDGATTIVGNTTITGSLTVSSSNATQFLVGSNLLYVNDIIRIHIVLSNMKVFIKFLKISNISKLLNTVINNKWLFIVKYKVITNNNTLNQEILLINKGKLIKGDVE